MRNALLVCLETLDDEINNGRTNLRNLMESNPSDDFTSDVFIEKCERIIRTNNDIIKMRDSIANHLYDHVLYTFIEFEKDE